MAFINSEILGKKGCKLASQAFEFEFET